MQSTSDTPPPAPPSPPTGRIDHGLGGLAFGYVIGLVALLILVWHNVPISGDDRLILACVPAAAGFLVGLAWPLASHLGRLARTARSSTASIGLYFSKKPDTASRKAHWSAPASHR